jgi:hypothetical protein
MNTFQWLLILGFPADVAASCSVPNVFAPAGTITANDLAIIPEQRNSPKLTLLFLEDAA